MDASDFATRVAFFIPVLLSLSVHEWAHAAAAFELGDETAHEQGRMTVNPLAHIDVVGTVLLPLLGIPFGWAKPVPINPTRFRPEVSMASGVVLTAVAGPLSNLVLAALCRVGLLVLAAVWPSLLEGPSGVAFFLSQAVAINLSLAIFNLLPLPPLDGSRVVEGFIPFTWRATWDWIASLGVPVLLILLFLPTLVAGVNPLGWAVGSLVRLWGRP